MLYDLQRLLSVHIFTCFARLNLAVHTWNNVESFKSLLGKDLNENQESIKIGLKSNKQKTEIMLNSWTKKQNLKISNQPLECVSEYTYIYSNY